MMQGKRQLKKNFGAKPSQFLKNQLNQWSLQDMKPTLRQILQENKKSKLKSKVWN